MSKISVVVGGQFGSEGKGAIAAWLARSDQQAMHHGKNHGGPADVLAVRVAGPNAGHTVIGQCPPNCDNPTDHPTDGHPWKLRHVPVAAVTNPDAQLIIGAGSEIDTFVLQTEIDELDSAGYGAGARLVVDNLATVIEEEHKVAEAGMAQDGRSTGKGIGAARMERVMRSASVVRQLPPGFVPGDRIDTARYLQSMARDPNAHILIEGTQGYGLGVHTKYYPYTTSSDCRAIDFLAMAGLSPWGVEQLDVWVVFRTRPIRIAGNSGPLEGETSWKELGRPDEFTTVTNKVRRVGAWDPVLAREAIGANGGGVMQGHAADNSVRVALTMADHEIPALAGKTQVHKFNSPDEEEAANQLDLLIKNHEADLRAPIALVGTGPASVIDLRTAVTL